ncbi:DUF1963 domain-containing protein [Streptomyces sp. RFCAC02]|uniref:DUF1963 domain-containing protein n=1 Tax=Streptomyces sp. RFCAC02 TaxID=2499143 RepID=UPI001021D37B|nr:DUF1963 domain-containing protein [Streptomyces sp. RFCAC02]
MRFDDPAVMRRICAERLGRGAGEAYAALARDGFRLTAAGGDARATGRCRFGGGALLEPGAAWPESGGFPLSLHAVLDTGALAAALGRDLPVRGALLNFFLLDPDAPYAEYSRLDVSDPRACRVIAADRASAVERAVPPRARQYPGTPVHASRAVMLPDPFDLADGEVPLDHDEDGAPLGRDGRWRVPYLIGDLMGASDGNTAGEHLALGWPDASHTLPVTPRDAGGPAVHLLQLAEDPDLGWGWGDAGEVSFTVPAAAWAEGDVTRAGAHFRCA